MEEIPNSQSAVLLATDVTSKLAGFGIKLAIEFAEKPTSRQIGREDDDQNNYKHFCTLFAATLMRISLSMSKLERTSWEKLKGISELLRKLEKLCTWGKGRENMYGRDTVSSPVAEIYPALFSVSQGSKTSIFYLKSFAKSTKPGMERNRAKLLDMLELFARHTEQIHGNEPISETGPELHSLGEELDDYGSQIRALYEIVLRHRLCSCEQKSQLPLNVILALKGCDTAENANDAITFKLFFSGHVYNDTLYNPKAEWYQVNMQVERRRRVRTLLTGIESHTLPKPMTTGFCETIGKGGHLPLLFSVTNGILSLRGPIETTRPWLRNLPCVSISEVLARSKFSRKMRLRLSCVIAKAVWQYYNSDWMLEEWTRKNIRFMLERHDLYDRPCLFADEPFLSPTFDCEPLHNTPSDEFSMHFRVHKYPKILALGILLIEIELGSPIETHCLRDFLGEDGKPNVNTYFCAAANLLNSKDQQRKWDEQETFSEHKSIIKACIDPQVLNMGHDDIASQREALHKHVVYPLESLFRKAWSDDEAKILPLPYGEPLQETDVASIPGVGFEASQAVNGTEVRSLESRRAMIEIRPRSRADFTIAIICALTVEANAVEKLFDDIYDELGKKYGKQPGDANAYMNGRIGKHNVVLCYMAETGKGQAASVASNLRSSYTEIQVALVVGICGGAPQSSTSEQIFLGDVIISDAVIEYDFGKQYPKGFQRKTNVKDILGRPPQEIRNLLAGLKAKRNRIKFQDQVSKYVHIIQQSDEQWRHPRLDDVLFEASYHHKHYDQVSSVSCLCLNGDSPDDICSGAMEETCSSIGCCDNHIVRHRQYQEKANTSLHIGTIASADTVMKSGKHRDSVVQMEGVIGFEMEGAGVWDNLPCIIIKGVSDYADSHKVKSWQAYAAANGASAAKTFLEYWRPVAVPY